MSRGNLAKRLAGWSLKPPTPSAQPPDDVAIDTSILTMLRTLGIAMLASSQATNDVESTLYEIASTYHLTGIRIAVLPTLVVLQLDSIPSVAVDTGIIDTIRGESGRGDAGRTDTGRIRAARAAARAEPVRAGRTDLDTVSSLAIRLDQAAAIDELVQEARLGRLDPDDAAPRFALIRSSTPRFPAWMIVVGHTVLCLGFGLTLNPTIAAVPAYVLLGAIVGLMLLLGRKLPTLASAMPVFAAFIVTVVTALFLSDAAGGDPLRLVTPALVSFLPGLTLTVASIELTSNQIIAGASRIVYGVAQLLLLTFGVIAGLTVTASVSMASTTPTLGWWTSVLGIALVALGYVLFLSAPKRSFLWILLALFVAYSAQRLGALAIGPQLAGFVGALVIVPISRLFARFRTAPPATVMTLASFWLLVPGALGFIGISETATEAAGSATTIVNTALSLFSIALGILVGTGLTRDFDRARRARLKR
ncbi:threonine/serine ThrE exporter family protein [Subtercola boreus]|uniref:Threonine/serine exporter-like N-terminal domain-containing protein n=1 Tax=Subtercola boreus TaxID=120213 RepID=A0A3E0WAL6_9MICO|nr:threonine/serine exporter family protein [Subtercola boreus]RFA19258.1 hypothetical protein B7R24_11395 [Subtercola boreus]RFA19518.1 hypothetical protein B7R23_11375 [Subtercola boreus]RFA25884.1 hypothetical protein B7R25_11495 [Subtercola boreus]